SSNSMPRPRNGEPYPPLCSARMRRRPRDRPWACRLRRTREGTVTVTRSMEEFTGGGHRGKARPERAPLPRPGAYSLQRPSGNGDAGKDLPDDPVRGDAFRLGLVVQDDTVAEHVRRHRLDVVGRDEVAAVQPCLHARAAIEGNGGARARAVLQPPRD